MESDHGLNLAALRVAFHDLMMALRAVVKRSKKSGKGSDRRSPWGAQAELAPARLAALRERTEAMRQMPAARSVHGIVDRLERAFVEAERPVGEERDLAIASLARVLDEVTTELRSLTL